MSGCNKMFDAISGLDEKFAESALEVEKKAPRRAGNRIRAAMIAAAACLALVGAFILIPKLRPEAEPEPPVPKPDPVAGDKAMGAPQIPLEWFEDEGFVSALARDGEGNVTVIRLQDNESVTALSDELAKLDWKYNVSAPEGLPEEGDVTLSCGDKRLSCWYGSYYFRYVSDKEDKWFLASEPMGESFPEPAKLLYEFIKGAEE